MCVLYCRNPRVLRLMQAPKAAKWLLSHTKKALTNVRKTKEVPAEVLELTDDYPPVVICNPCKKRMKANLSRNLENVKTHLKTPKHKNALQKMEAKNKVGLKRDSEKEAQKLSNSINGKHPKTFELQNTDGMWFLRCQICLGRLNIFPERGTVHNNIDSHMKSSDHVSAVHKASKAPTKFRQPSLFAFTERKQDSLQDWHKAKAVPNPPPCTLQSVCHGYYYRTVTYNLERYSLQNLYANPPGHDKEGHLLWFGGPYYEVDRFEGTLRSKDCLRIGQCEKMCHHCRDLPKVQALRMRV